MKENHDIKFRNTDSNHNGIKNKRPMGHIAHLRNQFKSMNTFKRSYDYIYYKNGQVVQEEKDF